MRDDSLGVLIWWIAMSVIAVVNMMLWVWSARKLRADRMSDAEVARYRRWQLLLSGIYVAGCASRSFILRADVQRFSMFDSFVTSVFVGRSIATVAEMSFVAQWSALLALLGRRTGSGTAVAVSRMLLPVIAVAETCSWYAVLTTNYVGNVFEESLWAASASLFMLGLVAIYRRAEDSVRRFLLFVFVIIVGYVSFMITVDVPMYIARWRADELAGRQYFSMSAGVYDAMRWVVTRKWEDWRDEIPWMSLYFSATVWMSLTLVFLPRIPVAIPRSEGVALELRRPKRLRPFPS